MTCKTQQIEKTKKKDSPKSLDTHLQVKTSEIQQETGYKTFPA